MAEAKKTTSKDKAEKTTKEKVAVKAEAKKPTVEKKAVVKEVDEVKTAAAKAGKRSAKAVKEVEEKQAKEARKEIVKDEVAAPRPKPVVKTRSKLERRGKSYRKASELIDKSKVYELKEALELAQKTKSVKFDATVEMHVNLNVDPKQADQNVRDTVVLPAGTGKTSRIAALVDSADAAAAKKAGADIAGEEILADLDKEKIDFDILVTTPAFMPKLGKYAKLLGPRGLMPNPKSGTVAADFAKAIKDARGGRVEYRVDSTGIVHMGMGKTSFDLVGLEQNAQAIVTSIRAAKPASIKGNYINSAYITTTMGPSIKVSL